MCRLVILLCFEFYDYFGVLLNVKWEIRVEEISYVII